MTNAITRTFGKLYDPNAAGKYVWHVIPKNYKAGTAASFVGTGTPDPTNLLNQGFVLVNPVQMGKYDDFGWYYTFKPPVDGVVPGKYVRVIQDHELKEAKKQYETRSR
tara:strand:- start:260 stop:583 length:324 start_codon:yes stop_codon:yes gene_type:complete